MRVVAELVVLRAPPKVVHVAHALRDVEEELAEALPLPLVRQQLQDHGAWQAETRE